MVDFKPPKPFKEQNLNKSKGMFDDFAVRKNVATRELNIQRIFLPDDQKEIRFYASDKTTLIAILDETGNMKIKGRYLTLE